MNMLVQGTGAYKIILTTKDHTSCNLYYTSKNEETLEQAFTNAQKQYGYKATDRHTYAHDFILTVEPYNLPPKVLTLEERVALLEKKVNNE